MNAAGEVFGSGTWTATQLLSFDAYGASPDPFFAPPLQAGRALIRVHLVGHPAGHPEVTLEADGVLRVTCVLPGAKVPANAAEGIRLNVQDLINFNKEHHGATLFIHE